MMKKVVLFVFFAVFFIASIGFAVEMTVKESGLLQAHVKLAESNPVSKTGKIEIYKFEQKETPKYNFKTYSGCVPVEISSDTKTKTFHKFFKFSTDSVRKKDGNGIITVYKEKSLQTKAFSACPGKELYDKLLPDEKREKIRKSNNDKEERL